MKAYFWDVDVMGIAHALLIVTGSTENQTNPFIWHDVRTLKEISTRCRLLRSSVVIRSI